MTDSMTLSTDTDGTTETEKVVKPAVLDISRTEISTSLNLKMGQGSQNLISSPLCFFVLFNDRVADGR